MPSDSAARREINDRSRNTANHHREPWSDDELEFLQESWDGSEETLREIALILGRTVEACRQRHYFPDSDPFKPTNPYKPEHTAPLCGRCFCYHFGDC